VADSHRLGRLVERQAGRRRLAKSGFRIGAGQRPARFGPTTPTRAGRLSGASVDPTDALSGVLQRALQPGDEGKTEHSG
jgi:hypothetical protein